MLQPIEINKQSEQTKVFHRITRTRILRIHFIRLVNELWILRLIEEIIEENQQLK